MCWVAGAEKSPGPGSAIPGFLTITFYIHLCNTEKYVGGSGKKASKCGLTKQLFLTSADAAGPAARSRFPAPSRPRRPLPSGQQVPRAKHEPQATRPPDSLEREQTPGAGVEPVRRPPGGGHLAGPNTITGLNGPGK